MFRFVSLCSGPCFALGRLHCPAAAGLRGCAMWRYVAPCRGPEISGGPGRISSGTAAGSAALSSHCFALGGIFSGNRAAFRVPVPEYAPVRAPFRRKVSRACFVPHALSHLFPESRGASRATSGGKVSKNCCEAAEVMGAPLHGLRCPGWSGYFATTPYYSGLSLFLPYA